MPGPDVTVNVKTDTSGLEKGMTQAANVTRSKLGKVSTIAAGVFGGAVLTKAAGTAKDFFSGAISMAMNAETANARFATTLHNVTGANKDQVKAANDFLGTMSKQSAMAKGELRPAFETILRGTRNVTKAQGGLQLAMNISAGTGKPLAAVSLALSKAYMGNTTALGKLGVRVKGLVPNTAKLQSAQEAQRKAMVAYADAVKKHGASSDQAKKANDRLRLAGDKVTAAQHSTKKATLDVNTVMKDLGKTYGGQFAKQADTTAGKMRNAQLQFKAMQTSVGQALMPVMAQLVSLLQSTLLPVLQSVATLAKEHPGLFKAMAAAVLILVTAIKLYNAYQNENIVVTKLVAAAQWLWNAALTANPIALVIIAIIALVAIIVVAYQKVGWFRAAIDAAWQAIQVAFFAVLGAVKAVFNWLKTNWPLILAILAGPVGLAVLAIVRNWNTIKAAATAVAGWVADRFRSLVNFFSGLPGAIAGFIGHVVSIIKIPMAAATAVVKWIVDKFEALVKYFTDLPGKMGRAIGGIVDVIKGPINGLIGALNAFEFTIPKTHIGVGPLGFDVGPFRFDFVPFTIPKLAQGGITTSEGLAWLHPAEVITPLGNKAAIGKGDTYIYVTVPPTANPLQTGRAIVDALRSYETVAGSSWRMSPTGRAAP